MACPYEALEAPGNLGHMYEQNCVHAQSYAHAPERSEEVLSSHKGDTKKYHLKALCKWQVKTERVVNLY